LIGSPRERQPTDDTIGTAPYLQSEYDEQYASGNLYSCPLVLDASIQSCSDSMRPPTPIDNSVINNRDAIGLAISTNPDSPDDNIYVS